MLRQIDFEKTPVVEAVNDILVDSSKRGASDIHFDPLEDHMKVRIRVDGQLHDYVEVPNTIKKNLITRIKIISGMNITESRLPQDGAIKANIKDVDLDLRVSSIPTIEGEKIVIRILDYSMSNSGLEALGFSDVNLKKVIQMINVPNGIILITGATGSGKSTTVYSILQRLNREETNIITVEDPIEMNVTGINQIQTNSEIGLDFATALRSILRQDPNIIMVGEIRDTETAKIAVRASITGHLVLSTIHTNDSLNTIERLLDMDVERYLLSSALTVKNYFNDSINKYAPVDLEMVGYYSDTIKDIDVMDFINSDKEIKDNTKDYTVIDIYEDMEFTYDKSLGEYYEIVRKKYPYIEYDNTVAIITLSDYKKIAKTYHFDAIDLKEGEYAIVSNYEPQLYQETINRNSIITIYGTDLKPYNKITDGFLTISANPTNLGFFVVGDNIVDIDQKDATMLVCNYSTNEKEVLKHIEQKLHDYVTPYSVMKDTKVEIKEASVGLSAIVTFIGLYLGIIFLISSSAILALKSLSDCIDDKNKYKVLRQIGADEKEINKALFKQTLLFFMMPLSIAVIHTVFGLKFCEWILKSLGITSILNGSYMTFIFLILIYGIYFIITYLCSKNIIREKI